MSSLVRLPPAFPGANPAQRAQVTDLEREAEAFVTKWQNPAGRTSDELATDFAKVCRRRDELPAALAWSIHPGFFSALDATVHAARAVLQPVKLQGARLSIAMAQLRTQLRDDVVRAFREGSAPDRLVTGIVERLERRDPRLDTAAFEHSLRISIPHNANVLENDPLVRSEIRRAGLSAEKLEAVAIGSLAFVFIELHIRALLDGVAASLGIGPAPVESRWLEASDGARLRIPDLYLDRVRPQRLERVLWPKLPVYVSHERLGGQLLDTLSVLRDAGVVPTPEQVRGIIAVGTPRGFACSWDPAMKVVWVVSDVPSNPSARSDLELFSGVTEELLHSFQPNQMAAWVREVDVAARMRRLFRQMSLTSPSMLHGGQPLVDSSERINKMLREAASSDPRRGFLADHNVEIHAEVNEARARQLERATPPRGG